MRFLVGLVVLFGALRSARAESYVEQRTRHVMNAFMLFSAASAPERQVNAVDLERDKDRLQMFHVVNLRVNTQQFGYGFMVFGAATFLAAHAPDKLRVVLSGPIHLGPAVFEGGGMGAGIAGRFL